MIELLPQVEQQQAQLTEWRRYFHQHPEPSLKEFETAEKIQSLLTEFGIPFEQVGETGTLGYITGTKEVSAASERERKIVLRADIDALEITEQTNHTYPSLNEGIMHACGHDAHTTALLGAAQYLQNHRSDFAGTILVAFQQAEEIGSGAYQFVDSGLLEGAGQVFGMHVDPTLEVGQVEAVSGPMMASCDIFTIEVYGKSSHVAKPHEGIDALVAGANIVTELQNIISRLRDPLEPAVIGIGKFTSGTRYNIVANHACIEGTLRTLSYETREQFLQKIEATAASIAEIYGAKITFSNYAAAAPVINDSAATERAQRIAAELVGEEKVIKHVEPSMGSDDFADLLKVIPGTYIRVGVNSSKETSYGLHHEKFDLDEAALPLMAQLHINYALDYLKQ